MAELNEIENAVRTRLRSLRNTLGLSLDELAARTNLSPSTISRVETGKRTISLDILLPLARALQALVDHAGERHIVVDGREDEEYGRNRQGEGSEAHPLLAPRRLDANP